MNKSVGSMKVSDLLESEWENSPISDENVIRALVQKEKALRHQREVITNKLANLQNNTAKNDSNPDNVKPWDWKNTTPHNHRLKLLALHDKIKNIDSEIDMVLKKAVSSKINMKYAKYHPEFAFQHARYVRQGRYPEGEDAIASNPNAAFNYARYVIFAKFPKGEPAIATDPKLKAEYEKAFGKINEAKVNDWANRRVTVEHLGKIQLARCSEFLAHLRELARRHSDDPDIVRLASGLQALPIIADNKARGLANLPVLFNEFNKFPSLQLKWDRVITAKKRFEKAGGLYQSEPVVYES